MAIVIQTAVRVLVPLLGRFGWFVLFIAFSRFGKRFWRWFWS